LNEHIVEGLLDLVIALNGQGFVVPLHVIERTTDDEAP
jgi:hypothetical protein